MPIGLRSSNTNTKGGSAVGNGMGFGASAFVRLLFALMFIHPCAVSGGGAAYRFLHDLHPTSGAVCVVQFDLYKRVNFIAIELVYVPHTGW